MVEHPLKRNRRQQILLHAETRLGPDVQCLRALSRRDLAILQTIVELGPIPVAAVSSLLALEPGRVEESLHRLRSAGLLVERHETPCTLVAPSDKCRRLKRAIGAME